MGRLGSVPFDTLKGKTIVEIKGLKVGSDTVIFRCSDGFGLGMKYYEDCCASCQVEDVIGDTEDLLGSPILHAEEVSQSGEWPEGVARPEYEPDSFTWTFYKLATIKGSLTIRWFGSSNGYYSEEVTIEEVEG